MDTEKVLEMLVSLTEKVAEIQGDIKVIKHDLESDYKALYGNGHPGIVERVENLERKLAEKDGVWKTIREWAGWLFAAINLYLGYKLTK